MNMHGKFGGARRGRERKRKSEKIPTEREKRVGEGREGGGGLALLQTL